MTNYDGDLNIFERTELELALALSSASKAIETRNPSLMDKVLVDTNWQKIETMGRLSGFFNQGQISEQSYDFARGYISERFDSLIEDIKFNSRKYRVAEREAEAAFAEAQKY